VFDTHFAADCYTKGGSQLSFSPISPSPNKHSLFGDGEINIFLIFTHAGYKTYE
jgi:hypothetical protein